MKRAALLLLLVILGGWLARLPPPDREESRLVVSEASRPEARHLQRSPASDPLSPPKAHPLTQALETGHPVMFSLGSQGTHPFLFRSQPLMAASDRMRLGPSSDRRLHQEAKAFRGWGLDRSVEGKRAEASVVLVGDALAAVIETPDGVVIRVRSHPETGVLEALAEPKSRRECRASEGIRAVLARSAHEMDWAEAETVAVESLGQVTGADPATGALDKLLDPIPRAPLYDLSLQDALVLLVLDKTATGPAEPSSLESTASLYLATMAHVAAVYEHQLGIRLRVQELILTPDSADYLDIPHGKEHRETLGKFHDWVDTHRPQRQYGWTTAARFGAGLDEETLGAGYIPPFSIGSGPVSIQAIDTLWDVIAHEIGHNLGAKHTDGGLMQATSLGGRSRSFFHRINEEDTPGFLLRETAAMRIYHRSKDRLPGIAPLRHPEEIPFARNDHATTSPGQAVRLQPLENDATSVLYGKENALSLVEVGTVVPQGAGLALMIDEAIFFRPDPAFVGSAWFSYTVQGSAGGWLHRGDVAVSVGEPDHRLISLYPGSATMISVDHAHESLSQPGAATVRRSRDDPHTLLVFADASARGEETFTYGLQEFTLRYLPPEANLGPDDFIANPANDGFSFSPLVNDRGPGARWLAHTTTRLGPAPDAISLNPPPGAFRIVGIDNLTPRLGTLHTHFLPFASGGLPLQTMDDRFAFRWWPGKRQGTPTFRYTVETATGLQHTQEVRLHAPPSTIPSSPPVSQTLIHEGTQAFYHLPQDDLLRDLWMHPEFDASDWPTGPFSLGFDRSYSPGPSISTYLTSLFGNGTSVYARIPFFVDDPSQIDQLELRVRADDGYVAYLNGREIARNNIHAPAPLPWDAIAVDAAPGAHIATTHSFAPLEASAKGIVPGENLLAIHGVNADRWNPDFHLSASLHTLPPTPGLRCLTPEPSHLRLPLGNSLVVTLQSGLKGDGTALDLILLQAEQQPHIHIETLDSGEAATASWAVTFEVPDTYDLLGLAIFGNETLTHPLTVVVGPPEGAGKPLPSGLPLDLPLAPQLVSGPTANLQTTSPAKAISWEWERGPGKAWILEPHRAKTQALIPVDGAYQFRLYAQSEDGITTTGLVQVVAEEVHRGSGIILAEHPNQLTSDQVEWSGFLTAANSQAQDAVPLQLFYDEHDHGDHLSAWRHRHHLEPVLPGRFSIHLTDLQPGRPFHFRLAVNSAAPQVSASRSFFTARFPLAKETLSGPGTPVRWQVPLSGQEDSAWHTPDFVDDEWKEGATGLGFDLSGDFSSYIHTDLQEALYQQSTSLYVRSEFAVSDPSTLTSLTLHMRYDDAFIAYLNGQEVARSSNAASLQHASWKSAAPQLRSNAAAVQPEAFDLGEALEALIPGTNVLAFHALNYSAENRDFLLEHTLMAERDASIYATWLTQFPQLPHAARSFHADPDGDGLVNLLEYASGLPPHLANASPLHLSTDGGELKLHYRQNRSSDATVRVESSHDLLHWELHDDLPAPSIDPNAWGAGIDALTVPLPRTANAPRYWRLRAR